MKLFTLSLIMAFFALASVAKAQDTKINSQKAIQKQMVEASCGICQFDLPGKTCALAVRLNGTAYYVDGTKIDEHGDAHAKDGFCNAVRKASVEGKIVNNRFQATSFKLLPIEEKKK